MILIDKAYKDADEDIATIVSEQQIVPNITGSANYPTDPNHPPLIPYYEGL